MISRRILTRIVPGVALVALLAGCTAPAVLSHAHKTPKPTPSVTVAPAATPGSRVPLKCADLFTPAAATALVGTAVTVDFDESTPPRYLDDVANAQLGVLPCQWVGGDESELGNTADVSVHIAPDSQAGFAAYLPAFVAVTSSQPTAPTLNTAGDSSAYRCVAQGLGADVPECRGQMLVGSYWVSVILSAPAPATKQLVSANTQKVLASVAAKLSAAGPAGPRWKAPASTPPGFCTDPGSAAQVRTVFAEPGLTLYPAGTRHLDAASIALDGPDASCVWSDPHSGTVDVELLAGGAWAFPAFSPTPSVDGFVQSYSPVVIPGVSSGLLGCDSGYCDAYLAFGTTAARVSFSDRGATKNIAALAALVSAIEAS